MSAHRWQRRRVRVCGAGEAEQVRKGILGLVPGTERIEDGSRRISFSISASEGVPGCLWS
jgi:hypothetical protein